MERQRTVDLACKMDPPEQFFNLTFFVDNQRPVGICLVHKAGSTTMKELMLTKGLTKVTDVNTYGFLSRYGFQEDTFTNSVEHKPFKTIMFVRNPVSRLICSYKAIFHNSSRHNITKIIKKTKEVFLSNSTNTSNTSRRITFREFVKYIISWPKDKVHEMDVHWRPQYLECNPCQIKFDFIGKLETISRDANFAMKKFYGVPVNYIPRRNKKVIPHTDFSLPVAYIRALLKLYKRDFMYFGYPLIWPY